MSNDTQMSFEGLMEELNKTLKRLEDGALSLEDSMKAYELGVGLVRRAEGKLSAMEGRMEEIMANGEIKELSVSTEQ